MVNRIFMKNVLQDQFGSKSRIWIKWNFYFKYINPTSVSNCPYLNSCGEVNDSIEFVRNFIELNIMGTSFGFPRHSRHFRNRLIRFGVFFSQIFCYLFVGYFPKHLPSSSLWNNPRGGGSLAASSYDLLSHPLRHLWDRYCRRPSVTSRP